MTSRIDIIGQNGGDGEHYKMITELDNKYLVLNWDDINKYLSNSEKRKLSIMIDRICVGRAKNGKLGDKKYTLVSETMPMYEDTTRVVLDWINGIEYVRIKDLVEEGIKDGVEKALDKERTVAITKATTKIAPPNGRLIKEGEQPSKGEYNAKDKNKITK